MYSFQTGSMKQLSAFITLVSTEMLLAERKVAPSLVSPSLVWTLALPWTVWLSEIWLVSTLVWVSETWLV